MLVKVGRLLQAGIGSFKVAVPASQIDSLAYGALVVVPVTPELSIFGVVADISFESDPLTRVMAGAIDIPQSTFESLRAMLARLERRAEALLLGTAVPMPLPIKSRRYDDRFWKEILGKSGPTSKGDASPSPDQSERLRELGF